MRTHFKQHVRWQSLTYSKERFFGAGYFFLGMVTIVSERRDQLEVVERTPKSNPEADKSTGDVPSQSREYEGK